MPYRGLGAAASLGLACGLAACSTTHVDPPVDETSAVLCRPGVDLGRVAVAVGFDWRPDQKAPADREAMATVVVEDAFKDLRCGDVVRVGTPDPALQTDVETVVTIVVREFGPELILSAPILWSSNTHVDVSLTARRADTRTVTFAAIQVRKTGGPFAVRSLADVPATLDQALTSLIYGHKAMTS